MGLRPPVEFGPDQTQSRRRGQFFCQTRTLVPGGKRPGLIHSNEGLRNEGQVGSRASLPNPTHERGMRRFR